MNTAKIRTELKSKSRIQTIAADLSEYMHANMFDDELRKEYHDEEINLSEWLYDNIEDGLDMLRGEGLIKQYEYELLIANENDIIDDIVEQAEEFMIDEIELAEEDDIELTE